MLGQIETFENCASEPVRKVSCACDPDALTFEVRGRLYVPSSQQHIRKSQEKRSHELAVRAGRDPDDIDIGIAVQELDFVRRQRGHGHGAASQHDVLGGDAVFVEDAVVEGGIQMHKTTRDRAGAHSYSCHRLARLGQIRISVGKFYTRVDKYNYPHERAKHVFDRTKAYQFHCVDLYLFSA